MTTQISSLMATNRILLGVLKQVETVLGENLVWIADQADLGIRQKKPETLRRLEQLDQGWKLLLGAISHREKMELSAKLDGHIAAITDARGQSCTIEGELKFVLQNMHERAVAKRGGPVENVELWFGRKHMPVVSTATIDGKFFTAGGETMAEAIHNILERIEPLPDLAAVLGCELVA